MVYNSELVDHKPKRRLFVGDCAASHSTENVGRRKQRGFVTIDKHPKRTPEMTHAYGLNESVVHRGQGPQLRLKAQELEVYTIVQRMPIESDGRLRYRIRSEKVE